MPISNRFSIIQKTSSIGWQVKECLYVKLITNLSIPLQAEGSQHLYKKFVCPKLFYSSTICSILLIFLKNSSNLICRTITWTELLYGTVDRTELICETSALFIGSFTTYYDLDTIPTCLATTKS